MDFPFEYEEIELEINEQPRLEIRVTSGPFTGIGFVIGRVWFEEKPGEQAIMHFDYDVVTGSVPPEKLAEFNQQQGDLIMALLVKSIEEKSDIVFTGGTE